jgi:type I restriction enzyme S subunit
VTINQGIIAMLCDGGLPSLYVLHWARSSLDVIKANASGSTFPEISKRNFKPIQVVVPKPSVLDAFVAIAEPLHERIVMTLRESELLRSVRCVLLPRLIAGEIRIPTSKHAAQIPSAQRTSR